MDNIIIDTAEIGIDGAGLTEAGGTGDHLDNIDLPNQTMDITGTIDTVTTCITTTTNTDMITADTIWNELGEQPVGVPAYNDTIREMIAQLWAIHFNEVTTTETSTTLKNSTGTTLSDAVVSDNGTTFTRQKHVAP
jgi:hypothetical protein